jgi:hypothetical protein
MDIDNDPVIEAYQNAKELKFPVRYLVIYYDVDEKNISKNEIFKKYEPVYYRLDEFIKNRKSLTDIITTLDSFNTNTIILFYVKNGKIEEKYTNISNYYKKLNLINPYTNISELKLALKNLEKNIDKYFEIDMKILDKFNTLQNEILKSKPLITTPLKITHNIIEIHPIIKRNGILLHSNNVGIEIFNMLIVSEWVPFIKYVDKDGTKYHKVYNINFNMKYYNIVEIEEFEPNFIYFSIFTGNPGDTLTKEAFTLVEYDLTNNIMHLNISLRRDDIISLTLDRIKNIFDSKYINFSYIINENVVSGDFEVYDISIEPFSMLNMIMNDNLKYFMYMDESFFAYPSKTKFTLRYTTLMSACENEYYPNRIYSPIRFRIYQYQSDTEINVKKHTFHKNTPFVRINISRADDYNYANSFYKLLPHILSYYKTHKEKYDEMYDMYFDDEIDTLKKEKIKKIEYNALAEKKSKLQLLKSVHPNIFLSNYSSNCQKKKQPTLIENNELQEWKNKVNAKGKKYNIFPYPMEISDHPEFFFTCENPEFENPTYIVNKLENNKDYPRLPCCAKKPFKGIRKPKKETAISRHVIHTDKILTQGNKGGVPENVKKLINMFLNNNEVYRLGMIRDKRSFLHCILWALKDKKYLLSLKNNTYNDYLNEIQQKMKEIHPEILKQEMYDVTLKNISARTQNSNIFIDPALFFRLYEEYFQLNIFVFTKDEQENGIMEIPRHKIFSARLLQLNKPCILIYKNNGPASTPLEYPQCELIITDKLYQYPFEVSKQMFYTFLNINDVFTFSIHNNNVISMFNIYSLYNFENLVKGHAISQIIDKHGKCRGIIFKYNNEDITMIIPPSPPFNLPIGKFILSNYNTIISVFKDIPTGQSVYNGKTTGLWFQVFDIKYGVFCPIKEINKLNLSEGPRSPINLNTKQENISNRIRQLIRTRNILLQLVLWIFLITKLDTTTFFNKYVKIGKGAKDSIIYYNFNGLFSDLPIINEIEEAMNHLKDTGLIKDGKVFLYSDKFGQGVKYYLDQYISITTTEKIQIPTSIEDLYERPEDFIQRKNNIIFNNEAEFKEWLFFLENKNTQYKIFNKLKLDYNIFIQPYVYGSQDNKVYIIQNVIEGSLYRALNVSTTWVRNKINLGYSAAPSEESDLGFAVFVISSEGNSVISYNTIKDENILLLRYDENSFAAMLEIL